MRSIVKARIRTLLAQQSGHIQLLIFAPILTLFLLSLVVRTANSAVDPTLEKKKITQQLKQRLIEVRNAEGTQPSPSAHIEEGRTVAKNTRPEDIALPSPKEDSGRGIHSSYEGKAEKATTNEDWSLATSYIIPASGQIPTPILISLTSPQISEDRQSPIGPLSTPTLTQWTAAKDKGALLTLIPGVTKNRSKKKEEKQQVATKLRAVEDVKKALESSAQSQPLPERTASNAPLPPLVFTKPGRSEEATIVQAQDVSLPIKKNETLEKILKRAGVSTKESAQWIKAAQKYAEFRTLRPGKTLEFFFSQEVDNPGLKLISYVPEEDIYITLERKTAKRIDASRVVPPTEEVWFVIGGRIEKNFAKSLKKMALPEKLAKAVSNLEWDIDLADLRTGDSFKILLEAVQRGNKIVEYKSVLAAELSHRGETFTAFLLPEERQQRHERKFEEAYRGVGLDIESEGEKFLRFPLKFARISSSFSNARFHPILHRTRRHNGIDFAAPRGTPVYSVAKGIVTFVGRQSGYGNIVKVAHPGPYETAYAHLQAFAEGLEEGAAIEKGRMVGYVGSTGLATGPHLHFELLKDGVFVNPFTERSEEIQLASMDEDEEVPQSVDPIIEAKKQSLIEKMNALTIGNGSVASLIIPQQTETHATATNERQKGKRQQASSGESIQR